MFLLSSNNYLGQSLVNTCFQHVWAVSPTSYSAKFRVYFSHKKRRKVYAVWGVRTT